MGNLCSSNQYDKDAVVRSLWETQRAIPVLPINPNLDALRVLLKRSDGYHDVGNVYSLCKPGKDKDWLQDALYPRRRLRKFHPASKQKLLYLLPPQSLGNQSSVIADHDGAVAQALVGPANAAAWFAKASSIQVCIPDCELREFNTTNWGEMMNHFVPDMSALGPPGRNHKQQLFILQKVLVVSHIKIAAYYGTDIDVDVDVDVSATVLPAKGVDVKASAIRTTDTGIVVREFTLSASQKNRKLPVAFSGFKYTFDKFGIPEEQATRHESDCAGESSHAAQESESSSKRDNSDEQEDEDAAVYDENMRELLEDDDGDENWFATVRTTDPSSLEILPYLSEEEEEEEEVDDDDVDVDVDQQPAPPPRDLEDIDWIYFTWLWSYWRYVLSSASFCKSFCDDDLQAFAMVIHQKLFVDEDYRCLIRFLNFANL